jgi:single-strand DNA-binding protein
MVNEAFFSVTGYVATQPRVGYTKGGTRSLSMRVGWTPRRQDKVTGEWIDEPSSFITVQSYGKVAEHGAACLHRGEPIVVKGSLRVREYADEAGTRRSSVEVIAQSIGHDMSRGLSLFSRPPHAEPSAAEVERAEAAAARNPLPGDRLAAEAALANGEPDAGAGPDADAGRGGAPDGGEFGGGELGAGESGGREDGDEESGDGEAGAATDPGELVGSGR